MSEPHCLLSLLVLELTCYKTMEKVKDMSVEELWHYLEEKNIEKPIRDNIRQHKIDGSMFVSLSDEELKELAPLLGDRLCLKRLISEVIIIKFFNEFIAK